MKAEPSMVGTMVVVTSLCKVLTPTRRQSSFRVSWVLLTHCGVRFVERKIRRVAAGEVAR